MQKLKSTIEQFGRWSELSVYINRIETHLESDFSHSLENAKALLEAIGKNICAEKSHVLPSKPSVNVVLKNAFFALGYTKHGMVAQISSSLATIGQQVGDLRNEIGISSHGKSLEEVKERNNKVDTLTRDFLIDTIEIVACFLIRNFENENPRVTHDDLEDTLDYFEAEDFNEYWDDAFGDFTMGSYEYSASEILFNVDKKAYVTEYETFSKDVANELDNEE